MLKDSTFKQKFTMLKKWMPDLIESIKKDIRNDHLRHDPQFHRTYLHGKNPQKLSVEDLAAGYTRALLESEKAEELGEYLSNRWLLKNTDLYYFFEKELTAINPNFSDMDLLNVEDARKLADASVQQFGSRKTYLFSVLNSVVFPKEVFEQLSQSAEKEKQQEKVEEKESAERASVEEMKRNYEAQLARLTDKYEKKLAGLERKYHTDVETLKKQITTLHRKYAKESS